MTRAPLRRVLVAAMTLSTLAMTPRASAALDLARAQRERLDNGLTVLVLEEHALPLVSVQMLYKVGARDEPIGRTGLAHFLEHMAFRASESFPNTDLVSRIYAVGGEWHGYTWTDQTTYYETLPRDQLGLALAIEADRMARLLLPAGEVEAERGAVLAELMGYQNDPATVLQDDVLATSFLQHPYRNNSIGWPSDVERLTRADVLAFYREHYRAANGVLAIVGDVDAASALAEVRRHFGTLPAHPPSPPPRTVEPPQRGERRVTVSLPRGEGTFQLAYRAPAASHPDYPAFLLLQELLGGTGGVSFLQATFGTPVAGGARLSGSADELLTWFPPSALPYVFTISGHRGDASPADVEATVEARLERLRQETVPIDELDAARHRLLEELTFDLETTEDAAHQLAFFEGIGALDVLRGLPDLLADVGAADVRRVAAAYLQPWQRTVGWVTMPVEMPAAASASSVAPLAAEAGALEQRAATPTSRASPAADAAGSVRRKRVDEPVEFRLTAGMPVLFQSSALSPTGYLLLLLPATSCDLGGSAVDDQPVWRHTSAGFKFLAADAEAAFARARATIDECNAAPRGGDGLSGTDDDLDRVLSGLLGIERRTMPAAEPLLIALAGDLEPAEVRRLTTKFFGDLVPGRLAAAPAPRTTAAEAHAGSGDLTQARLGYAVPAPPPADPASDAWRMLLYILSHDYEGRLGIEAISRRGLVYHIASEYHCDGESAWISLETGVDPNQLAPMRALLSETRAGLRRSPPSDAEIAEARHHLLGRRLTGAQSNRELAERLARDAICFGGPLSVNEYRARLERVGREQIEDAVPAFIAGAIAVVE